MEYQMGLPQGGKMHRKAQTFKYFQKTETPLDAFFISNILLPPFFFFFFTTVAKQTNVIETIIK